MRSCGHIAVAHIGAFTPWSVRDSRGVRTYARWLVGPRATTCVVALDDAVVQCPPYSSPLSRSGPLLTR